MSFLTVDFETYYSREFSLSKMTTEEYVRAPQFEIIGVSVKEDGNPALWFSGTHDEIRHWMRQFDWEDSAVLAHNALFDGAILEWVLGFKPKFYYDTLCMARAIHSVEVGGSLANLVKEYSLGEKGTEVIEALDVKRAEFTPEKLERYGAYCRNDVELTYKLFGELASKFPEAEFGLIDMTLKMFFRPQLMVDDALLVERLEEVRAEKQQLLAALMEKLNCTTEEDVRKRLCSNNQFAEVLREVGVEPPMKISPSTEKPTYAFAKNDEGFLALTEHPDPIVQQLCAVRLGTKSTIEESRIERFIGIGGRNKGWLPVPLKYYGAHTGRWAGVDKVNFQNLPSRDKKKKALKNAVIAPPGYVVINCDSSQIEARVLAWLAGQDDVVQQFRDREDVYSTFATKVYGYEVSKKTPVERFVGKTCVLGLGYGTGAAKLQHTLKTSPPGADLPLDECDRIVKLYRETNYRIKYFWAQCEAALHALMGNVSEPYYLDEQNALRVTRDGIQLPNGLLIRYPGLRLSDGKIIYVSRYGIRSIWGGAVTENVVQALARIIVGEQMLKVNERYPTALTVHDAGVWVVPEAEADEAVGFIVQTMSTAPTWCHTLPVACEAKSGRSYGEC